LRFKFLCEKSYEKERDTRHAFCRRRILHQNRNNRHPLSFYPDWGYFKFYLGSLCEASDSYRYFARRSFFFENSQIHLQEHLLFGIEFSINDWGPAHRVWSGEGAKSRDSAMSPLLVRKGLRSKGHAPAELCMLDHPPDGAGAASNCLILGIIWGRSMRMTLTDVRPSGSDPRTQDDRCRRCRRAICCRGTTVSKISPCRCQARGC